MARLLALNALFFLAPFAVYAGWLAITRGSARNQSDWTARVVLGLCLAGAILMGLGLILLTSFSGAPPETVYRPAVIRDGQIVPGEFGPVE